MIVKENDGDAQNNFANPVIFFTLWVLIDRTFKQCAHHQIGKEAERVDPFAELYEKYQPDVYRFLLCLCGGDALAAEELTQECFYQAFLSFGRFRGECTVRTWLCQIAKNVYGKYIRKESRQRSIAAEQTERPGTAPSVAEEVEQKAQFHAVRAAMETLGEPMRTVAEYKLCCGLSYAEIAKLTGVRPETAAVMCSRARQKLKKILREEYGYEI